MLATKWLDYKTGKKEKKKKKEKTGGWDIHHFCGSTGFGFESQSTKCFLKSTYQYLRTYPFVGPLSILEKNGCQSGVPILSRVQGFSIQAFGSNLAYKGQRILIVFRFHCRVYSSLRDFYRPLCNNTHNTLAISTHVHRIIN